MGLFAPEPDKVRSSTVFCPLRAQVLILQFFRGSLEPPGGTTVATLE